MSSLKAMAQCVVSFLCLAPVVAAAEDAGQHHQSICRGVSVSEISASFWSMWTDYHALSQINQGDAPYRVSLVGTLDSEQTQQAFNACLDKLKLGDEKSEERYAIQWIIEHEAMRLTNPVLMLNFSTVYSWLDQYRVASASQPWQTIEGQVHYAEHVKALPLYIKTQIDTLKLAAISGYTQSCVSTEKHLAAIKHHLTDDNFYFDVLAPFQAPEEENIQDVIKVVGALSDYAKVLEKDYLPACRKDTSVYSWQNGRQAYADALRYYTSTNLSADEVHAIGFEHVALLMKQVEAIRAQPGFMAMYPSQSAADLFRLLRDDPRLGFKNAEEMLAQSAHWGKVIRDEDRGGFGVPKDFPTLKTEPVPASIASSSAEAMYQTGSDGVSGTMYINTSYPEKARRYALPAALLHEGFPGHHYQVFHKFRNDSLSLVRKKYYFHALGEGWALYTESLMPELLPELAETLPHPDLLKLGVLSYDLLRAVRLVVDTGLHAKGWDRERAVAYIVNNTAVSEIAARNAVERFISLPAQATSYKLGHLAIADARQQAQWALGKDFNAQRFHQAVLLRTSLPLTLFQSSIMEWIAEESRRTIRIPKKGS